VPGQCPADRTAAGDHVQHVVRQHFPNELNHAHDRQRRLLRRLEDDRVAGRERRRGLARGVGGWPVERNDAADHPIGVQHRDVDRGDRVPAGARQLARQAGEELEGGDGALEVEPAGLGQRLADLA
jgi:hypothetical protein